MNLISSNLSDGAAFSPSQAAATPSAEAGRPSIIRQYLRIALRWKHVIIGATVACVLLGLVVTLLMTPKYTATATVEISTLR